MGLFVFVDTSGWIASFVEEDQHHEEARSFIPSTLRGHRRFLTTDLRVRRGGDAGPLPERALRGREGGGAILESKAVTMVEVDSGIRGEAWRIFKKYSDQELSFTDCTSVVVMRKYGLGEVFTFDEDFGRIGFGMLPGPGRGPA